MSGDVQPRKRKDKKRKKDELGVEEPRGTAAVLGEGDVFMHSQHEHGTGGHWCAKIIFFSLLAVLVTLIGLIILENRGLTELEANSVESRYSGVLEGWLEDAPDDDHHDEHTLELLKHHDDDDHDEEHEISQEDDQQDDHDEDDHDKDEANEVDQDDDNEDDLGHDEDDDENEEDEQEASNEDEEQNQQDEDDDDDDDNDDEDDDDDDEDDKNQYPQEEDNSEEQPLEADEDDDDDDERNNNNNESAEDNDDDDNDDLQQVDENDTAEDDDDDDDDDNLPNDQTDQSEENNDEDENSKENDNDEEHEEQEEEEGDSEIEVEKLEKEVSDEDALSEEQPTQESEEEEDKSQEVSAEAPLAEEGDADETDSIEDEEFLEADDIDDPLPVVERIVAPKGKPLVEVEDEPTTTKPADTLADEEEYEKQQEQLRREEAQASHVWLKLAVGGALLVATHAVVSRAVAPRDDTPASEGHASREDTPSTIDRRMTLIPEESAAAAPPQEVVEEIVRPIVEEKVFETVSPIIKSEPPPPEEIEEEEVEEEEEVIIDTKDITAAQPAAELEAEDKELYSEEDEEVEEEEEEEIVEEKKKEQAAPVPKQAASAPKQAAPAPEKVVEPETEEPEAEDDVPDDVEIIDDEQLEEELEEEELEEDDEEEISDVDDAELLSRLEAKYGRLPEPDRPEPKHKDGGNSIEADWPGEPSDKYWRQQLDEAEQELRQVKGSVRARWILARAIDASAEAKRDNRLLTRAITAYLDVLKLNEQLSDVKLREITDRTLDRIRFRGNYLSAEPVYRLLIRRFPEVVDYRNNMTVSLLMANRADLAEEVIKETLRKWPNDRIALAHLGFILKTQHNRLEEAVEAFQKALEGDIGPATEPRFYYHLGDALLLLGRFAEAHEVHKRGAKLGHFLSPAQRSLYNVERLKSRPWWDIEQTPYLKLAHALEKSWKEILKEGQAAQALYEKEKEGLKEKGEWSQLDLFVRGQEVPGRCKKAPVTCSVVRGEVAAAGCRRGQIKFSSMEAGTHVRPHVGPTNCRLRMHLGLSNTKDTYIRVDQETRQWQVGKVFMFDDSFEHEVWHNGTGTRLVLIVDVWHPALSASERRTLPPI